MRSVEGLLAGEPRALARAIRAAEDAPSTNAEVLRAVYPHTGSATVVGITGPPGAGKSSLVDRLVASFRADDRKVAVLAVDPSSAFSGGAILGDRVRMQGHATDPDVFIRSMATRGHLGGLARATNDAIDLMDAAGYDPILVETVGVGQDEVEIVKTADVVAVVLVPGMGDDIQAIKAGILEIADVFVINKADREGADRLQADLEYMLTLMPAQAGPKPSIFRTVAVADRGVVELKQGLRAFLAAAGHERRKHRRVQRAEARFMALLGERLLERIRREAFPGNGLGRVVQEIADRRLDPYSAAGAVLERMEIR